MEIVEFIKQNYLLPNDETVALIHESKDDYRFMTLSKWCKKQNWKFVHIDDIMGSEASVVILYECDQETELYSRAKNCLIMVHK